MNEIKNKILSFKFLILLLIPSIISELTVYPDHYIPNDSPYSFTTLYLSSDIKERQIYKLGFFSNSNTVIQSYKYGYTYRPDHFCKDLNGNDKIQKSDSNRFFNSIPKKEETREKENFSEELELLENYCYSIGD